MASNGRNSTLLSLVLSTGSTLLWDPLLAIARRTPRKPTIFLPIYAYVQFLMPIDFFLNIVVLFLDYALTDARNPQGSRAAFLKKHFPQAVHTVSFATLMLSAPLFMHAAVSEESTGFAVAAALVCLALITVLASGFKKLIKFVGLTRALCALCMSTGFLISHTINDDILPNFIVGHLPLQFLSFVAFTLSMALVILRIGAPSASRTEDFVMVALSVAIAALLVGDYLRVYVAVTDMVAVVVETGKM